MTFTVETLHNILTELSVDVSQQFWVAYSGGLDSHVLLHALSVVRKTHPHLRMKAVHINHGISPNANEWAQYCVAVCKDLEVECILKTVDVPAVLGKDSPEAVARKLRYQAFKEVLGAGDYVFLAHHVDDQAETFLLQALRGAGIKGLSSMPHMRSFSQGMIIRPLLNISREHLKQYAEQEKLSWIEDESNTSIQFDRNHLRHHIFSQLIKRFPGVKTAFSRSASHCAEANRLLDELAQEDLRKIQGSVAGTLSISHLLTLSHNRQKNVLRFWIQQNGFLLPSKVKLAQLQKDVLLAQEDACPCLTWEGAEMRRYQDDLYLMHPLTHVDTSTILIWHIYTKLVVPGLGSLVMHEKMGEGLSLPDNTELTVRFRQGGERMRPAGAGFSRSLKKLYQEWGVPPWLRDRIPLLYHQDTLVMVVGYALSEHYIARDNGRGWVVLVE